MYEGAPDDAVLPLTAHHIIPWNRIRDFWNFMIVNQLFGSAQSFLLLVDKAFRAPRWVRAIEQGNLAPEDFDQLIQCLCWAEGNLVWGPSHRADDPGDQVDDMSTGAGREKARIARRVEIAREMKDYIALYQDPPPPPAPGPDRQRDEQYQRMELARMRWERSRSAVDADPATKVRGWKGAYANQKIVKFDPNMWSIMSGSQGYTPSVNHDRVTHPKWVVNR
jgi:hypothetical protein